MAKSKAHDGFLVECEPYFLDGALTVAQFAQRTQEIVRHSVERQWESLIQALGFGQDEVALLDFWDPDKLQKAKPTDDLRLGVKLKVGNLLEAPIYRYWTVENRVTGIEAFTWIKSRTGLNQLSKKLDDLQDVPEPHDAWDFYTGGTGVYFINRPLGKSELTAVGPRLDEFITYYIALMTKVGGVKHFLSETVPPDGSQ
jgi:hypothetical protein